MRKIKKIKKSFVIVLLCAFMLSGIGIKYAGAAENVSAPVSLTFSESEDKTSCTITWKPVSGAVYNVYKAVSRYASYGNKPIAENLTTASFTDTDYDGGYYKVTAVLNGKESAMSKPVSYEIATFGYDTNIFEPTDNTKEIQSYIDTIFKTTESGQFRSERYALMFAPGVYADSLNVKIGFYTQAAGMGISPKDTVVGNIRCQAEWMKGIRYDGKVNYNALCNFWRSCENLTTTASNTMWAVSQATSMRRMNIEGNLLLHHNGGYASGGFLADTKIAGDVSGASQQQWLTRNSTMNKWEGVVWNNVMVGCGAVIDGIQGEWPDAPNTIVVKTPEIIEKPFLTVDEDGEYSVFVPEIRKNSEGVSWDTEDIKGKTVSLEDFYVAKPLDSASKINKEIKNGKNLILTPGIYNVSEPIRITNKNTIVLGLGYATVKPTNGNECMIVSDVDGVVIAGVLFDAGRKTSKSLLTVGEPGSKTSHADNPIALCDTFYRVGGADTTPCKTNVCVTINSSDVIGDNFWVWRADHGAGVGWTKNSGNNGIIINGDNVTVYGLMVEHFQKYQTIWNGNNGKCYMYQSELPYDITSQGVWNAPGTYGYADYKVGTNVTKHEGYGMGIYSCYQKATCFLKSAIECPDREGVQFTNVCTYSLSGNGGIDYVINKSGYAVLNNGEMSRVMSYSNGKYTQDKTYENARKIIWIANISAAKSVVYSGKSLKPRVSVTYKGIKLREGTDYTITYKNNKKIGTAKIYVKGINGFKDSEVVTFRIIPDKTKITKKKASKKKISISFKKIKGANGYQVVYSNKSSFKKKSVIKTKKTRVSFKRAKRGAYYVKVRAYKKSGKKYIYGAYCKKVKIK